MSKVASRTYINSTYIRDNGRGVDYVVVSELAELEDGTVVPQLKLIPKPKRVIYYTKPQYRRNTVKKEAEQIAKCDRIVVENSKVALEVFRIKNGFYPTRPLTPKQAAATLDDLYLYGANIDIRSLIANRYLEDLRKKNKLPLECSIGTLDIETSVRNDGTFGRTEIISFTYENTCYTAVLKDCMFIKENGKKVPFSIEDVEELAKKAIDPRLEDLCKSNKQLKSLLNKLPFKRKYRVCETPLELVQWIMKQIHTTKPGFVGVWNILYDMPRLEKIVKDAGLDPKDVFCPPDLPEELRYFKIRVDNSDTQHNVDKWHTIDCPGYTTYIDPMCLYGQLRRIEGKEVSYALDAILNKHGLGGKLYNPGNRNLPETTNLQWHIDMQDGFFLEYTVYNQGDVIFFQMLLWLVRDIYTMIQQCGVSTIDKFPRQTVRLMNKYHFEWQERGEIIGTYRKTELEEGDNDIVARGGAVLSPKEQIINGWPIIRGWNTPTAVYIRNYDIDLSAQYPTALWSFNIGKDTILATVIGIYGEHLEKEGEMLDVIENVFARMMTYEISCVDIGVKVFNLPHYEECAQGFAEEYGFNH